MDSNIPGMGKTWPQMPLPLANCVNMSKLLDLFEPQAALKMKFLLP